MRRSRYARDADPDPTNMRIGCTPSQRPSRSREPRGPFPRAAAEIGAGRRHATASCGGVEAGLHVRLSPYAPAGKRHSGGQAHDVGVPVGVAGFETTASSSRTSHCCGMRNLPRARTAVIIGAR